MSRKIDETGNKYGRLTVIEYAGQNKFRKATWLCKCECGNEVVVIGSSLRDGVSQSCNCLSRDAFVDRNTTHGMSKTKTWRAWRAMFNRCHNENTPNFHNYGGRGISICDEWKDFEVFFADVGTIPEGLTIDRIDNNGNYEPGNIRIATQKKQCNNMRKNRMLEYQGETKTMMEWSEITGMNYPTIQSRLLRGWSVEQTLSTPVR